ncbi:MAG: aldehyde ferredoxin oxidoreductase family protein [Candidatus Heimdallarchaeota archaeon]|nr:aldehyde ferredoxin oxidoreductase family protein [Candidatus Heimdallarchaeota archaeon]MCK4878352.1 aldehyde ferredoxin oxidoreductase family protein [Candidatus Heimdallarchaeota archaeon]
MSQPYGYTGKILWVDMTTGKIHEENPSEEIYRNYLGGYGLGVYYIYTRIEPRCDPLGPKNILGLCPGLLTGTVAPFTGRWMVCGKSPLTGKGVTIDGDFCSGGWGDSNSGGYFGPAIKRAGYDAIFITGTAKTPVYLYINKDSTELIDAAEIWGKDAFETEDLLKEKYGKGVNVATIGVAAENKSLITGIVCDHGRMAARSGLGAVMGSKKLKAICLDGRTKLNLADKEATFSLSKKYREKMAEMLSKDIFGKMLKTVPKFGNLMGKMKMSFGKSVQMVMKIPGVKAEELVANYLHRFGTAFTLPISVPVGDASVKNFSGIGFSDYPQEIALKKVGNTLSSVRTELYGCFGCPLSCGKKISVPELGIKDSHKPEYETLASWSSNILNDDPMLMIEINEFLNRQGLDSISTGVTLSFVLECVEHGLLTQNDFKSEKFPEGFLPKWGETEYILPLLKMIVHREGIGDLLADGTWEACQKIQESKSFAMNAAGSEIPMHDPRYINWFITTYLSDPTPGRHTAAGIDTLMLHPVARFTKAFEFKTNRKIEKNSENHAFAVKFTQSINALGLCSYSLACGSYPLFELIESVFGWQVSPDEFLSIGWRIQTLRQMFNAREGAIRHEIPKRLLGDPPAKKGPLKGVSLPAEQMIQGYYKYIGFREDGVPEKVTLKTLGLDFCIQDLALCRGRPQPIINQYLETKS